MQAGGFIGAYRLEEPVGEGGMGAVWKARHPTLDRRVAIKVIRSEVQDRSHAREAFLREVRILSRLHGPQIVQVVDFGFTDDGDPYMVTEFLDGEDLLGRLRRAGALGAAEATRVGVEVLKALSEAHAIGLVHRDLKPGNVFIQQLAGDRTAIKVLDFGVAKLLSAEDGESTLWPGARLKGSPRYMSPEQITGGEITPATDIYAFGAMLYRVITGEPVFPGNRQATLEAHVHQPPQPMRERVPLFDVPAELDEIVLDCLQKDPRQRPRSAAALQTRMERLHARLSADQAPTLGHTPTTGQWRSAANTSGGGADLGAWFSESGDRSSSGSSPSTSAPSTSAPSTSAPSTSAPSGPQPTPGAAIRRRGQRQPERFASSGSTPGVSASHPGSADQGSGDVVRPQALLGPMAAAGRPSVVTGEPNVSATEATLDSEASGVEGLQLAFDPSERHAQPIGADGGIAMPSIDGELEPEPGDAELKLELAFEPDSRAPAPEPQGPAVAEPPSESGAAPAVSDPGSAPEAPPSAEADPEARPQRAGGYHVPAAGVRTARVPVVPWYEQYRTGLMAGGGVLALLVVVWLVRGVLVGGAGVDDDAVPTAEEAVDALEAAEPKNEVARRALEASSSITLEPRGTEPAPPVARGPAASAGAPSPDDAPTVLVRPDPGPATFIRVTDGEVLCEEAKTCRVPIDVDIKVTRAGYRALVLKGDDLYDRRGSTWRVILRR